MNDIETSKAKSQEVSELSSLPSDERKQKPIEEFWKAFERRQCELLREGGIALSKILKDRKP